MPRLITSPSIAQRPTKMYIDLSDTGTNLSKRGPLSSARQRMKGFNEPALCGFGIRDKLHSSPGQS